MKPSLILQTFIVLIILIANAFVAEATHLRAGQITATRLGCDSRTFRITIVVYTNTGSDVLFGGDDDILDFGDGSDPDNDGRPGILVPEQLNIDRSDLGKNIGMATFTIDHTYRGNFTYVISYSEPNRNEGVLNMDGSVNTRFYIETQVSLDPYFGCNQNTPILQVDPIDVGCTYVQWSHNPGAVDLDGDSLSYEMLIPFRAKNSTVINYRDPNDPSFYTNYNAGNETGDGPPIFRINNPDENEFDGTITWNAPGSKGEYNIAFLIREWRRIEGEWVPIGFVRRDMQIIIEECDNERPDLIVPEDLCVVAGTTINETIFGIDPDNDQVKIEAFSDILENDFPSNATITPDPPTYQASSPPAEVNFNWVTDCSHVKDQPYQVVFKITDNPPNGPKLVTYKTWRIKIVAPPPVLQSATAVSNKIINLQWDPYTCQNAKSIQIWRRVDSLPEDPSECVTGMPEGWGYQLIDVQDLSEGNTYADNNGNIKFAPGAIYCYRLVAAFPQPKGGESYVSNEVCVTVTADAPVMTNVTVDVTDSQNGQITVKWLPPFQSPIPVASYYIYRSEGFNRVENNDSTKVAGTSFTDTGLNTANVVYNYMVKAFDASDNLIGESAVASSVRLEAQSQLKSIQLSWSANVPWSIQTAEYAHKLYRVPENDGTLNNLTFLTDINVIEGGLSYTDQGETLEAGKTYCYVVETVGAYGNADPVIANAEPFINYSQIVCSQLGDDVPPCKPETPIADKIDCNNINLENEKEAVRLLCNLNSGFENTIYWNRPTDGACGANDIAYYLIYFSKTSDGTFVELLDANNNLIQVRDTFFVHKRNLTSFAGCYKIAAVDRSGNVSELSEAVCYDNCYNYELPNIFTPNDDDCNRYFSAFGYKESTGETGGGGCGTNDPLNLRCARYVNEVKVTIFNRWGKTVHEYQSEAGNEDKSIYINWDGRSDDGADVSPGIYYYVAEVTFDTSDPSKRVQNIRGWVHLVK